MIITTVVDGLWCPGQSCSSASGLGLANRCVLRSDNLETIYI